MLIHIILMKYNHKVHITYLLYVVLFLFLPLQVFQEVMRSHKKSLRIKLTSYLYIL